jgi:hypothetical protein
MRSGHLSTRTLVAGILGIALGACGNSTTESAGSGGMTGTGGGSGGVAEGSGGAITGSGGAIGTGGTTTPPGTGGSPGSGGATAAGGAQATGGTADGTGGRVGGRSGAGGRVGGTTGTSTEAAGGAVGSGGGPAGETGGTEAGGRTGSGGRAAGGTAGGGAGGTAVVTGTGGTGRGGSPGTSTGPCTASKDTGKSASGSGPHKVVIESNSDAGINCGTIYRPADLGGDEKYPIFVWGEGACTRNGLSNQASMAEIASWGYFVVADGPPGSGGNCSSIGMSTDVVSMAKPLIAYIDWAIAENGKTCSAYYDSLDTTKIASDGFSCGGLMAMGVAGDPRTTAFGYTSSGLTSAVASYYKTIHTPVKILLGGSGDVAYTNGMRDYDQMVSAGVSVLLLSKNNAGHGGDLNNGKGDFNTVNLAWLNWQLKGDTGATGKALLIGSSCKYCNASGWEFKSNKME